MTCCYCLKPADQNCDCIRELPGYISTEKVNIARARYKKYKLALHMLSLVGSLSTGPLRARHTPRILSHLNRARAELRNTKYDQEAAA